MCGLCALLGNGKHWSDVAGRPEFDTDEDMISRRQERRSRMSQLRPVLKYYGITVKDWGGSSYILGKDANVSAEAYELDEIWTTAQALTGQVCDPLDTELLLFLNDRRQE